MNFNFVVIMVTSPYVKRIIKAVCFKFVLLMYFKRKFLANNYEVFTYSAKFQIDNNRHQYRSLLISWHLHTKQAISLDATI